MSKDKKKGALCAVDSLAAEEPLYGTAAEASGWILIEYRGRWSDDAYKDSSIPKAAREKLKKIGKAVKGSRLQVVSQNGREDEGISLFISRASDTEAKLYEINLGSYEDLASLDVDSVFEGDKYERKEPLVIVCTNGERDTCCGKFGKPVFLEAAAGPHGRNVWQTNHIGGHRFAATFICLPHGICYGRVREGKKADEVIDKYLRGEIDLASLRGRSCYSAEAQAAEYFLRAETGKTGLSEFTLKREKKTKDGIDIDFVSRGTGETYRASVLKSRHMAKVLKNCGDGKRDWVSGFINGGVEVIKAGGKE